MSESLPISEEMLKALEERLRNMGIEPPSRELLRRLEESKPTIEMSFNGETIYEGRICPFYLE